MNLNLKFYGSIWHLTIESDEHHSKYQDTTIYYQQ